MNFFKKLFGFDSFKVKFNVDELVENMQHENPQLATLTRESAEKFKVISKEINKLTETLEFSDIFKALRLLRDLTLQAIILAEAYARLAEDTLEGEDKLKTAVEYIDNAIEFPGPLEYIDGKFIRIAVDYGVGFLNRTFGKDFLEQFANDLGKYRESIDSVQT